MTIKHLRKILAGFIFFSVLFVAAAQANPKNFMEQKKLNKNATCNTCHITPPKKGDADKKLNPAGLYYLEHKQLPNLNK